MSCSFVESRVGHGGISFYSSMAITAARETAVCETLLRPSRGGLGAACTVHHCARVSTPAPPQATSVDIPAAHTLPCLCLLEGGLECRRDTIVFPHVLLSVWTSDRSKTCGHCVCWRSVRSTKNSRTTILTSKYHWGYCSVRLTFQPIGSRHSTTAMCVCMVVWPYGRHSGFFDRNHLKVNFIVAGALLRRSPAAHTHPM